MGADVARRQWGAEKITETLPTVHPIPSGMKMALGRLAIIATVLFWAIYVVTTIIREFVNTPGLGFQFTMEAISYLIVVTFLTFSALMHLVARQGAMERFRDHRRAIIIGGNLVAAACLLVLAGWPQPGMGIAYLLLVGLGLFGTSFPLVMSYGKGMLPKAMLGRGVTLLNFFGIGATGIAQIATGRLHAATEAVTPAAPFQSVFLFFAIATAAGLFVYLWSQDRPH